MADDDVDATHEFLVIMRIISVITIIFSGSVLGTIAYFPDMQKKWFFKCIFWISAADVGTAAISMIGFPDKGILCTIQGIGAIFFPIASWCWTTLLSYSIYSIIRHERVNVNIKLCHVVIWTLSAACGILPLTTSQFTPAHPRYQWCVIAPREGGPVWAVQFWIFASFFGWFILFIVLMLTWSFLIFYRLVWQQTVATKVVSRIYNKLWLYPVAVFFSWTVNLLVDEFAAESTPNEVFVSMIFGLSSGIWSALIFFMKSSEARSRWYQVLYGDAPENDARPVADSAFVSSAPQLTTRLSTESMSSNNRSSFGQFIFRSAASPNDIISRRGFGKPRSSLRAAITEDFDVDDDGGGGTVVYYEDRDSFAGRGSSSRIDVAPSYEGNSVETPIVRNTNISTDGVELRVSTPADSKTNATEIGLHFSDVGLV